jgi:Transposase DDE domain group 1
LQLSVLAYNLGNLWRRLVLPKRIDTWSLTSVQQRLVKTGGRLVKHARYHWLLLPESHLTRRLFGVDAPAGLGLAGADGLVKKWRPDQSDRERVRSLRAQRSVFQCARGHCRRC